MAQKATETAVRDLQKCVADLTKRICDLECKLMEQNAIITTQSESIIKLKLTVEGTSKTQLTKLDTQVVANTIQARPIRQVRLNAAAAKTAKVSEKKRTSVNSSLSASQSDITQLPVQQDAQIVATKPTSAETCGNLTIDKPVEKYIKNDDDNDEWKKVVHKRTKKNRKIVTGIGNQNDDLQPVDRLRYLQAWSLKPETTEENVLKYINTIKICDQYTVQKRTIKTDKHASFVIGFPESLYKTFSSPSSWPPGVKLSDWFLVRPRVSRGDLSIGAAPEPSRANSRTDCTERQRTDSHS